MTEQGKLETSAMAIPLKEVSVKGQGIGDRDTEIEQMHILYIAVYH